MSPGRCVAAVDCGTNTTRLLVSGADGSALARELRVTRLGEGVDATGALAGLAIERTVRVLQSYREQMDQFNVDALRVVATSAVRSATNGSDFLDAASAAVRARVELLLGEEEGRLAYAGAVSELDPRSGPFVVLDIGGGSTELTTEAAAVSLDLGCVRLSERYLQHDPPLDREVEETVSTIRTGLDRAAGVLTVLRTTPQPATLVGLAGTVTTLSMLAHGWSAYEWRQVHHSELSLESVEAWTARLAAETVLARAARPGMVEGREDVIVGGALVLRETMRRFGFRTCLVSESDILDGLVASIR